MTLDITREELRADITEITSASSQTLGETLGNELKTDILKITTSLRASLRKELRADILEITTAVTQNLRYSLRKELRADILEITASVAQDLRVELRGELRADMREIATDVVRENNHVLIRMINEDLEATDKKINNLDRRLSKRSDETNTQLRSHISDPRAHSHTPAR